MVAVHDSWACTGLLYLPVLAPPPPAPPGLWHDLPCDCTPRFRPLACMQNRGSALPQMSHRLFEMVGKPAGKPPAPYKPRGPKSPPSGPAVASAAPGVPPPPSGVPPAHAPAAGAPAATPANPAAAAAGDSAALQAGAPEAGGSAGDPLGPAAAAAARAAATAAGEVPAGYGGGPDPKEAMAKLSAEYPAELIRIAALVRRSLGMQRGSVAHLRMMLKTLHLAGQVRCRRPGWLAGRQ